MKTLEQTDLSNISFDETALVSSITRKSFYDFVLEFWDTVVAEKFIENWHIPFICNELQKVAERVFARKPKEYDLIINVSPGSTKSTVSSIMFPAWIWTRMASAGVIGCSYTEAIALDMSRKQRELIKSEKYQACFPKIRITRDVDAKGHFANKNRGERNAVGTGGNVTGRHGDFIIVDDPINPRGARSQAELKEANLFLTETLWSRKKEKHITPTIVIQQRLGQGDTTAMLLEMAESTKGNIPEERIHIRHICLPAELTDDIKPEQCKDYYVDGLFDPVRLSKSVLGEAKMQGAYVYAGQYLQRPIPLGGAMFNVERITIDVAPPVARFVRKVRYWDKAGTKDSGAYSVGVQMGLDKEGRFWILDVQRGQWDSATRERHIKQTAEMDGHKVIVGVEQEPGSGGKESAENTVRNLAGYVVRVDRPSGDKAQRADPYSTQVNSGNVYMVKGEWNRAYIEELRFFSLLNSKEKDQVDASSGGFKLLNRPVAGGWKI
jgi:predicted phage terminase large subunit-like protein